MRTLLVVWLITLMLSTNWCHKPHNTYYEDTKDMLRELDEGPDEEEVISWLGLINDEKRWWSNVQSQLEWNYNTDITDQNADKLTQAEVEFSQWILDVKETARYYLDYPFVYGDDTKRQLTKLAMDASPKDADVAKKIAQKKTELEGIYATATVEKDGKEYNLEKDLNDILANSRDTETLLWAWKGWRDVTGPKMREPYKELVKLLNKGAYENGYPDIGAYWRQNEFMDTQDLEELCERQWQDLKPLYEQLHTYVRRKLVEWYGKDHPELNLTNTGSIPAHLLGNMWAQSWENIFDIVAPYPNVKIPDISQALKDQGYDVIDMFHLADKFYQSIGLEPMTDDFWKNSMMIKPKNRDVQCHASAFNFYDGHDFRIKMCTKVDAHDLQTIHHEMGHIQYFMEYSDQPAIYSEGANSAFHEAIGDTISLSVMTNTHLKHIGLITDQDEHQNEHESDMNYLMKIALSKLAFLPFGYLIDKWRWAVFDGSIDEENYNAEWWKLRFKYQGLSEPVMRTEADFDPGSKYHVPANSPYICYFVSFISQFQFYEALCEISGHKGALHHCDFFNSRDAGETLKQMLSLGSSRPWQDAMEVITGQPDVSTLPIQRYFQPLMAWLKKQNQGEHIGWE